jgi:hypothetical protein
MRITNHLLKMFDAYALPKMPQGKRFGLLNFQCHPVPTDLTTETRQAMQIFISQTLLCLCLYSHPLPTQSSWSGFALSFQIDQSWESIAEIWCLGWERFTALPNRCPPYFLAHNSKKQPKAPRTAG